MNGRPSRFLSCDWGTSNFRLRLVCTESLETLAERSTDEGVRSVHERCAELNHEDRQQFFATFLRNQISQVLKEKEPGSIVAVASGMLGSSIGMLDLEYAPMPFGATGSELFTQMLNLDELISLVLVSGVKSEDNLMRGEEVQAIGLADYIPIEKKGVLILPGTHSKHIHFSEGWFRNFKTFMTGEIFEVLITHSILRESVVATPWNNRYLEIFTDGVRHGAADNMPASLFAVRSSELLGQHTKKESFYYLSGLLIGSEITAITSGNLPVILAATGELRSLYRLALEAILPPDRFNCLDDCVVNRAVLAGHRKILDSRAGPGNS